MTSIIADADRAVHVNAAPAAGKIAGDSITARGDG
jgi:hypothetical protein